MLEFYTVKDVMNIFKVKQGVAYKIIKDINNEFSKKGYLTVRGRVFKDHLERKLKIES